MEENNNLIVELDKAKEDTLYDETDQLNSSDILGYETDTLYAIDPPKEEEKPKPKKPNKPKKEFFWNKMSKKAQIITLVSIFAVLLITALLVLYFLVWRKPKKEEVKNDVIVEKSSYVYKNGTLIFKDKEEQIGKYKCKNKDPKKCLIAKFTNEDDYDYPVYENEKGKVLDNESRVYAKRYVFINDGEDIVFYDLKENKKIDTYKLIKTGEFKKDLVIAKNEEGKYGLYEFSDDKYEKHIDFKFDNIGLVSSDERTYIKMPEYSFIGDLKGSPLSGQLRLSGKVKNFDNNFIAVLEEGKYNLYDYQGKKVLKTEYDYISFDNGYVFAIKEGELYVYDKGHEKLNEAPLKLKTSEYKTKYIIDSDNKVKETISPYYVKYSTGQVILELPDTKNKPVTRTINLYEAALNKKYAYFKYLDGFLYFFDDAEKENLIGTYSCSNKNIVTSTTTEFNNCVPAVDTNIFNKVENPGYSPIINKMYAFIRDTQEGSSNNVIVLYDMKGEKNLVRYQEVDTGKSSNTISFIDASDDLVFAKNMDGNYGAIKIGADGPTLVISFADTTKISEFSNDRLLVKRTSGDNLYDKKGTLLAKSSFNIIEFENNYLVVKNKGYLIYKMNNAESGTILTDELDYLKMYSTFIVGIKNRKLNVYNLSDAKKGVLPDELSVINTKLESSYKLTIENNGYKIDILKGDGSVAESHRYNKDWSKVE